MHFGENDRSIRVDSVREFQAKLKTLNDEHENFIYPNTGPAFGNSSGKNYNRAAAHLAWQRALNFLTGLSEIYQSGGALVLAYDGFWG